MSLRIDILTLFPEMFGPFIGTSIPKRAADKGLVEYQFTNIRDFATDAHKSVDDKPFGGIIHNFLPFRQRRFTGRRPGD